MNLMTGGNQTRHQLLSDRSRRTRHEHSHQRLLDPRDHLHPIRRDGRPGCDTREHPSTGRGYSSPRCWPAAKARTTSGSGSGHSNILQSVTATSASNAWTAGFTQEPLKGSKNMILHWNGTSWTQVPSPNPFCATCDSLYGVAATSASSAWAVGTVNGGGIVVVLRWNGTAWKNFPSAPSRGQVPQAAKARQLHRRCPRYGGRAGNRIRTISLGIQPTGAADRPDLGI